MKRALLVGIDHYQNFNGLAGCCNDVNALMPLLARNDDASKNFDCVGLTSVAQDTTRDSLLTAIDDLLAPAASVALLYFAGHGKQLPSDVALVATDGTETSPGIAVTELLGKIASSEVPEVIVILDCCFGGGGGGIPQLGSSVATLRPGLSILTASRGDQTSSETPDGRGLFSTYLCGGLEGGAADTLGRVTVAGLYSYLSELFGAWDQRPTFKSNIDRLHELRSTPPAIDLKDLRRLAGLFQNSGSELPLDPSYEPDADPDHEEHEADFAVLQKGRAAKLVEPVGEDHLYFAAMNSKSCRLTALGRHYWELVTKDRI